MTMNENENHVSSSPSNKNYAPVKSFDVVLVDIKKAAEEHKIHCVKKSLDDKDLKYVALTYRRGDLKQVLVDTQVGYTASITGFDLNDFYMLCNKMTEETDLKDIDYVWVNEICVDRIINNEAPYLLETTKLQQMMIASIYEQAQYILAVPDLLLAHLKCNRYHHTIYSYCTKELCAYIYHLLHGNMQQLVQLDEQWLANVKSGISNHATTAAKVQQKMISERMESIQRVVQLLMDLFKDWSSRIWHINIYQTAKRQNSQKLKFWFMHLEKCALDDGSRLLTFFKFDGTTKLSADHLEEETYLTRYQYFQRTIDHQLNQQTFLEMMLRSKSILNKNRFKAILPLTEYKHLQEKVDDWQITDLISVKLKLFEFMHTKDKLDLLYLTSPEMCQNFARLPTFTSSPPSLSAFQCIAQEEDDDDLSNFDLTTTSVIQLAQPSQDDVLVTELYQLKLSPKEYYTCTSTAQHKDIVNEYTSIYHHVLPDDANDIVCIPRYTRSAMTAYFEQHGHVPHWMQLFLLGSFVKNQWICIKVLTKGSVAQDSDWLPNDHSGSGFILY
ncbi:unnamed protein product [Absidia cylindrospora]